MLIPIQKIDTDLKELHKLVVSFFSQLNTAATFANLTFPSWYIPVFHVAAQDKKLTLNDKFKNVFDAFKALPSNKERQDVLNAFTNTNRIEDLCEKSNGITGVKLIDLYATIQDPIDELFKHLWSNSLKGKRFTTHFSTSLDEYVDKFTEINDIEVCPICGIEKIINLTGEARTALDHWLCKDTYPYISVNFDNLVPLGTSCNARPAKGTKDVVNEPKLTRNINRIDKSLYPYCIHNGISVVFNFINEPTISSNRIIDTDWQLTIKPNLPVDQQIFESWMYLFNIQERYKSTIKKVVFRNWQNEYRRFIDGSAKFSHANNLTEFRSNLNEYRNTYNIKYRERSVLYIVFLNYLIRNATNKYLQGLCDNFRGA